VTPPERCSFCNRSQEEVRKLIAGPDGVAICDGCVEAFRQVVHSDKAVAATRTGLPCPECNRSVAIRDEVTSTSSTMHCPACGHHWSASGRSR